MRGADVTQEDLFVTRKTSDYVPAGHPLVAIREILNRALRDMDLLFESIYEERGRYSVPPEWLLRGLVLQALYGIRSERLLCEQLGYNMLYRWFVGLSMDDAAWDHSTYTKNRDRLIEHEVVRALFEAGDAAGERGAAALRRALQRRRHADPGVGLAQEFRSQGRSTAAQLR